MPETLSALMSGIFTQATTPNTWPCPLPVASHVSRTTVGRRECCWAETPLGPSYHALDRLGVSASDVLAVFGCGPIGLGAVTLLRFLASRTIAVDPIRFRRQLAKRLGADQAIDPGSENPIARISYLTARKGVEVALECSGATATTELALDSVTVRGCVAFLGEKEESTIHPSSQFIRKEHTAFDSWCFTGADFYDVLDLR
jgi:threonine dehydrogenase-like Zn-dependent dehydrogenase